MKSSYPVSINDAFILHTHSVGEADRMITALTRNNGLMHIYARSVRREGAKMRGAVKPYGCVSLSVVIGRRNILKDIIVINTLAGIWRDAEKYTAFVTLLQYVRSLVPVPESHDENIFAAVETAAYLLEERLPSHAENILLVAQVMILTALGYTPETDIVPARFSSVLEDALSSPERCKELRQYLRNALQYQ